MYTHIDTCINTRVCIYAYEYIYRYIYIYMYFSIKHFWKLWKLRCAGVTFSPETGAVLRSGLGDSEGPDSAARNGRAPDPVGASTTMTNILIHSISCMEYTLDMRFVVA